jgi:tRNA A-37 threonylcarbamoyl transferase component Bud32
MAPLEISASRADPALLDLPWETPLEEWPEDILAALPRGISRHVVRFVRVSGRVLALKEINHHLAHREYQMLRVLGRIGIPAVVPFAVVSGRTTPEGDPLDAVLITRHLQFSLPYRAVFSQVSREGTVHRLLDALAVLLVRLHLEGFYWGDVSLSNTLFRRDAGAFAAYIVDVETGSLYEKLTDGQRAYDLDLARTNIIGELMDLQAGEMIDPEADVIEVGDALVRSYRELWATLTEREQFSTEERWRVSARIERLNQLGFDVGELEITTDLDGTSLSIQPKVVDAGHHARRLMRLTGIDAQENQARRLLNDLDHYRAVTEQQAEDEEFVAHEWLQHQYEPVVRAMPRTMRSKLELPEFFHEVLEHKWFLSEQAAHDISLSDAVQDYIDNVLAHRPDEKSLVTTETSALPIFER